MARRDIVVRVVARDVLAEPVHDVDAKTVDAAIEPEARLVVHGRHDLWVRPVQVGLLGQEEVQVVLPGGVIEGPGRCPLAELGQPVVGRTSPGSGSRQMYQSRFALVRDDRLSTNHGCSIELWLGTQSSSTLMPRSWNPATSLSRSSRVPKTGSTSR